MVAPKVEKEQCQRRKPKPPKKAATYAYEAAPVMSRKKSKAKKTQR